MGSHRKVPLPRKATTRVGITLAWIAFLVVSGVPAFAALPNTSTPVLQLARTIRTTPFVNTTISAKDAEGSAFVPRDNSLWLVGDNARAVYEINPITGELKRVIDRSAFEAAPQYGGGPAAGPNRPGDLESLAYDDNGDILIAFSGTCCTSSTLPTAFRLTRQGGVLQVESYQPLPSGADYTAAAWNSADGKIYVGKGRDLRTYDYVTNTSGPTFRVPKLSGILGLDFTSDGVDLLAVTSAEKLFRVDWATKKIVGGWSFDLLPFGVRDSRAVEVIPNPTPSLFDQLYVFDGYDSRPTGDPLKYAVFVFDVFDSAGTAPTASFTASPASGNAPLQVAFTDTSSGNPTSWQWAFGDGNTSQQQHPTHTYGSPGTYTVTLTVSNSYGQSTANGQITALADLVGNPGFEASTTGWNTGASLAGVTLTRVEGGHSGTWAARPANGGTTSGMCMLNDHPNWVGTTVAGTYSGRLWVRADAAGATLRLRFREYSGASLVGSPQISQVQLTTSWQRVTVTLTPQAAGTSKLDFTAYISNASPGNCFYADDASISVSAP